ncbi:MAG: 4Fe-4S binding protein [Thermodesulfobacteriota bacterium]
MADVYKQIAERLDQLPNGFPATESGVEIKLLKKIFRDPDDAGNWLMLSAKPEPIEVIAGRFEKPVAEVQSVVDGLVAKGLINAVKIRDTYYYHIQPFVIGLFEKNLLHGLIDREYAEYYEAYFPEFSKTYGGFQPAESRVIPLNVDMGVDNVVHVYDDARKIVEAGKTFKLLPCVCRYERKAVGQPCPQNHPVEMGCIAISYTDEDDVKYPTPMAKSVSKQEAMAHLERAAEAGLIHQSYNLESNNYFICNCCTCCCLLLRGALECESPHMMLKSNYVAQIDEELCIACGTCADERCQVDAIEENEDFYAVKPDRCIGCGVCVSTCPSEAITLKLKPESEQTRPLKNLGQFYIKRALARREQSIL